MDSSALQYMIKGIVLISHKIWVVTPGPTYGIYTTTSKNRADLYEEFGKCNMLVTSRLIKLGFLYVKVVRSFKTLYINLMSKYNVCMERHVSEGICGLYDGFPSVYKLVTTRRRRLWTLTYLFHIAHYHSYFLSVLFIRLLFIRHSFHSFCAEAEFMRCVAVLNDCIAAVGSSPWKRCGWVGRVHHW